LNYFEPISSHCFVSGISSNGSLESSQPTLAVRNGDISFKPSTSLVGAEDEADMCSFVEDTDIRSTSIRERFILKSHQRHFTDSSGIDENSVTQNSTAHHSTDVIVLTKYLDFISFHCASNAAASNTERVFRKKKGQANEFQFIVHT
jgi:hypothetical protein